MRGACGRNKSYFYHNSNELLSDLDVDYIIEGSVKKSDSQLQVHLAMVTADEDELLWSETFIGTEKEFPLFIQKAIEQIQANIIQ